jgi:hypothetical protein
MLKRRRAQKISTARRLLREVLAPIWCRNILKIPTRRNSSKNSNKRLLHLLRRRRTRKRKKYFTCGKPGYYAKECPDTKGKPKKKSANMIEADGETSGYGNLLHIVLSVFHLPDWWIDTGANIHMCADISLFSSYQVGRTSSLLMRNGARAAVHGVGTVDLKLTSRKIVQHVPSIRKN